jgi:hypothetical protein
LAVAAQHLVSADRQKTMLAAGSRARSMNA